MNPRPELHARGPRRPGRLTRPLALLLAFAGALAAQPLDVASTRAFLDQIGSSTRGGTVAPRWLDDGVRFWFTEGEPLQAAWLVDPAAAELKSPLFDLERARTALERAGMPAGSAWTVAAYDEARRSVTVTAGDRSWRIDLADDVAHALPRPDPAEASWRSVGIARDMFPIQYRIREQRSPDGKWIATCRGPDVVLRSTATGQVVPATRNGTELVPWYFASDINEPSGSIWSPDGTRLALRTHDMTAVPGFPLVDWLETNPEVSSFRYWAKSGQPLPVTTFHVFDVLSRRIQTLALGGDHDSHLAFLDWSPDGREVWFYRADRTYRKMELIAADVATGAARVVLAETREDGFVEFPWNPIQDLRFLKDGRFLWHSDRSGWAHWYLYQPDGRLIGAVTSGEWTAEAILHLDEARGRVFLTGNTTPAHPYDEQILVASLAGGTPRALTSARGRHRAQVSPGAEFAVVTHSFLDRAPRTDLVRVADGALLGTLASAVVDQDFRGAWAAPEEVVVKAADGVTDVHGVILKPWNFDPTRKYPVIERIYGAMQAYAAPRTWFGEGRIGPGSEYTTMLAWFCRLGFAVVILDTPGTPGRGREYQMRTSGTWPRGVVADHVAGLKELGATRPWLDLSRVGIEGNSWGGYMATRSLIEAPTFYRAGSASVPEVDFHDHLAWIEFQVGSPRDNPEAYRFGSNLDKLGQIRAPFLVVAGTHDGNVSFSANMKLLDALAAAHIAYEYVLFPGTNHSHQGRGDRYAYAVTRIGDFFLRHLGATHSPHAH